MVYGDAEQNLGWTREDDPAVVAGNRERFLRAITRGASMPLTTCHQIHGNVIHDVSAVKEPMMTPEGKATLQGDGLLSGSPGRLLGIVTADCVPVLLADTRTRAVAALHAGWRGTLARIVESGVARLQERCGSRPEQLIAAIGPSIRSCCFEVGEEVRAGFEGEFRYAHEVFRRQESATHMDLTEANRRQLLDAGVLADNISVVAECTACARLADGTRKYYSHRAEHGFTGRMLNVIGAVAE